jgi:hypothetical protein
VNAVVDDVPGDDQLEIWDVRDAGVVGFSVAGLYDREIMAFEHEPIGRNRHRRDK